MPRSLSSIAVFCGSNFGNSDAYAEGARRLGQALAAAGITMVYGGTMKGLMGVVADALIDAGGTAHGVITEALRQRGHTHPNLQRSEIVPTLRARKERMAELADAFIAMPGGIGTMEEMMEVWTMNQLSEIDKPVGLLNISEFYQPFLAFIDRYGGVQIPAARAQAFHLRRSRSSIADRAAPPFRPHQRAEVAVKAARGLATSRRSHASC